MGVGCLLFVVCQKGRCNTSKQPLSSYFIVNTYIIINSSIIIMIIIAIIITVIIINNNYNNDFSLDYFEGRSGGRK